MWIKLHRKAVGILQEFSWIANTRLEIHSSITCTLVVEIGSVISMRIGSAGAGSVISPGWMIPCSWYNVWHVWSGGWSVLMGVFLDGVGVLNWFDDPWKAVVILGNSCLCWGITELFFI